MLRILVSVLAGLVLVTGLYPSQPLAQEVVGSRLFGVVTDSSGAVIPGVEVKIVNPATGYTRTVLTGDDGTYVAPQILAGTYNLEVSLAGFKSARISGLLVRVNENIRQDVRLEVGEMATTVEVSGKPALINTYTADLAQTVDSRRIIDLPLNARDVTSLSMLAPGTTDPVVTGFYASASGFEATAPSVNGSRIQDNSFYLDGVSNLYSQRLSANLYPNPDAIQEFTVNTGQYSAEFGGRPGGQLSAVTKSGTNRIHGTLFEFARNPVFNARRWEDTRGLNDGLRRHQYGFSLGGPVYIPRLFDGRNKMFWFTSYQGIPVRERGTPGFVESWTAKEKAGNFSEHFKGNTFQVPSPACDGSKLTVDRGTIFDPRTANPACGAKGFPFPNNIIPSNLFDPVASNLLNKHTPTSDFLGQLHPFFIPGKTDEYQFVLKLDFHAGEHAPMFRWIKGKNEDTAFNDIKNLLWQSSQTTNAPAESYAFTDTWVASPTLVLTAGFVYLKNPWNISPHPNIVALEDLGSRLKADEGCRQMRAIQIQGRGRIGWEDLCGIRNNWNWESNVGAKWVFSKHEMAFGGSYGRWGVDTSIRKKRNYGSFNFTGAFTGISAADFLIGRAETFTQSDFGQEPFWFRHVAGLYFQDNIRANKRLTFNLGLRWEPFIGVQRTDGPVAAWIFPGRKSERFLKAPPGILYAEDPGTPGREAHFRRYNHFAPRLGFALDLTGDGKWAIRGGVGQYFGIIGGGNSLEAAGEGVPPLSGSAVTVVNPPNMVWPYDAPPFNGVDPLPLPAPGPNAFIPTPFGGYMYDPHSRGPNTWHFSLTVEHRLNPNLLLRAGYVRTRGVHLQDGYNYNLARYIPGQSTAANVQKRRPDPNFTAFHITGGFGDSWYNSLQVTAEQRYTSNLSFLATYTLSKSIDTNSGSIGWAGSFGTQDPRGPTYNKGLSNFDRTHVFNFAPIWDLPKLTSATPALRHTLGGWQVSSIVQLRSGYTLTPTASGNISLAGPWVGTQKADITGTDWRVEGRDRPDYKTIGYFNQLAFRVPPEGTFGNAGRGIIRGPGWANVDFLVGKMFHVGERVTVQFRSEYFNLFNRVNLGEPILDVTNRNFGKILGTFGNPRILQFGLKVGF